MHVTITVRFDVYIDETKTLPLATLAEAITDQNVEARLLDEAVERFDEQLLEAYCGEKHARGNGDNRFQRAGTATRSAVTTAGEHDVSLHHVHDTAAAPDETAYFRPIEDVLAFDGQNRYQRDISIQSIDRATTLSYRDAADDSDGILSMPSRTTINRRVKAYGSNLSDFLSDTLTGRTADTVIDDGTKCHSQEDDTAYNDVHVTLGEDTGEDGRTLLDVSVDEPWTETTSKLDEKFSEETTKRIVNHLNNGEDILDECLDEISRLKELRREQEESSGVAPPSDSGGC